MRFERLINAVSRLVSLVYGKSLLRNGIVNGQLMNVNIIKSVAVDLLRLQRDINYSKHATENET